MRRVRFGCHVISYGDVEGTLRYGVMVEEHGLDVVSLPDHLFHPVGGPFLREPAWDSFMIMAALAVRTSRVTLMTVTDTVRRHPAVLANEVSTLDHLSGGRTALGIGAGELFNFAPLKDIRWDKPFTRFREALTVLRGLWLSTPEKPLSFKGRYFHVEGGYLGLKPLQKPHPPLYIAGYGPRMKRLMAEVGDGWVAWMHSPGSLRREVEEIRGLLSEAGRSPDGFEVAVILQSAVLEDSEKAWRLVAERVRPSLCVRPELLRSMGYGEIADEAMGLWRTAFTREEAERILRLSERIPMEAVREVSVAGTPREALQQVERFIEAGATLILISPVGGTFNQTLKAFRDHVIPHLK